MKRLWSLLLLVAFVDVTAKAQGIKTNAELIEMISTKLPDDLIVSAIKNSGKVLDTSPMALVALKKAGASDVVLRALFETGGQSSATGGAVGTNSAAAFPVSSFPMAAVAAMPGVTLVDGSEATPLTLTAIAYRPGFMRLMTGFKVGEAIAEIRTGPAIIRSKSRRPSFQFSAGASDAPQNSWGILPLSVSGKSLKFPYHSVLNQPRDKLVLVTFTKVSGSSYVNNWVMTPNADLSPGEYVVLFGQEGGVQPYHFGVN